MTVNATRTTLASDASIPNFKDEHYTIFLVVAIILSTICIMRILIEFCLSKKAREIPTGLMVVRAIFNYIAVMLVLIVIKFYPKEILKNGGIECQIQGAVFLFCLYMATIYYAVICWELSLTLKNPFRAPSSGSTLFHFMAIFVCLTVVISVAAANKFAFRPAFQICFMTENSRDLKLNVLNLFLIYLPVFGICVGGIIATIWSVRRLQSGINRDTFACRMLAIKQQTAIISCFSFNYFLQAINWCILFTHIWDEGGPYLLSGFCLIACLFDAVTWIVRAHIEDIPLLPVISSSSVDLEESAISQRRFSYTEERESDIHVKNISDALRKEVIGLIIDGLSRSDRKESELITVSRSVSASANNDYREMLLPEALKSVDGSYAQLLSLGAFYPDNIDDHAEYNIIDEYNVAPIESGAKKSVHHIESIKAVFRNYAPKIFNHLRRVYGVTDEAYYHSIKPMDDVSKIALELSANFSEGRSGAFLFFTKDKKYLIKTINKNEAQLLLKTLRQYVAYMTQEADTYLLKYFGLHSIKLYGQSIYFVVNNNLFSVLRREPDEKYDLKGSWVDRSTNHRIEDKKLMKDADLKKPLSLERYKAVAIYKQLEKDTEFLCDLNIMDYSLLLGVYYTKVRLTEIEKKIMDDDENNEKEEKENNNTGSVLDAEVLEGAGKYCIGIIDMLQKWDRNKKVERFTKAFVRCKNKDGISCVPPKQYCDRFLDKMEEIGIGLQPI